MWLLLIEDEVNLAASLKRGLEEEGYAVEAAYDGEAGYALGLAGSHDVMVVDWRLPKKDGRTVVQQLREAGCGTPILMLTALGGIDHRVGGLDAGADDYLTKPFAFEELLARLRALMRRAAQPRDTKTFLKSGALEMNTLRRNVRLYEHTLELRAKEYALLELFMRHPEEVLSRTMLAERVWGAAFFVTDNVIDVTMSRLRQKLADACSGEQSPVCIETLRGVGYRLNVEHQGEH